MTTLREQRAWALCLWREARGEGTEGMRAVAWVIWNRSLRWKKTIMDVVMGKNQFTSMSESKKDAAGNWAFDFPADNDLPWLHAKQIVADIVSGADTSDPTGGAVYYANLAIATSGWFFEHIAGNIAEHPETVKLGRHTFYA